MQYFRAARFILGGSDLGLKSLAGFQHQHHALVMVLEPALEKGGFIYCYQPFFRVGHQDLAAGLPAVIVLRGYYHKMVAVPEYNAGQGRFLVKLLKGNGSCQGVKPHLFGRQPQVQQGSAVMVNGNKLPQAFRRIGFTVVPGHHS